MRRITIFFSIALICTILFSGCGNEDIQKKAKQTVDAFDTTDYNAINKLIFGTEQHIDSNLDGIFDVEDNDSDSILKHILKNVNLSVQSSSSEKVVFEVKAPNMENVFENFDYNIDDLQQSDLSNYIIKYADKAEIKTFIAEVPVRQQEDSTVLDYKNSSFINAITGGLLDAYKQLYTSILEQYAKDVN